MADHPDFRDKVDAPGWRDLVELASQLDGFPKYLAQHPGGMVIGSTRLTDLVPVQPGAIEDRYILQWDKDSVDDAGLVIRRQRPLGRAVFFPLEDEHGHIPLVVWPGLYSQLRHVLREPMIAASSTVSRREGTVNIVVSHAQRLMAPRNPPAAKNWG